MKASIGRVVHYFPLNDIYYLNQDEKLAAIICGVNEDGSVNLQVFPNCDFNPRFLANIRNDSTTSKSYWAWPEREE